MDLHKAIRQLYEQRAKLDKVIANLEELQKKSGAAGMAVLKKRRGRKSMDAAARKEVSERMRKYWEARRQKEGGQPESA